MSLKKYFSFILVLALSGCFAGRKNNGNGDGSTSPQDMMSVSRSARSGESFDWNRFVESESSSFVITKVEANVNTNSNLINPETQLHEALAVDFKVYVAHRGTRLPLFGHKFRVSGYHGEEVHELEAQDKSSAISWTEYIEFDPLKPQFDPVLVVRKVEGLGSSNGYTNATFELNPWAYFESELGRFFNDLTYEDEVLSARYSDFDPGFNYLIHLDDPTSKAPELNIASASFYINREETEMILSDISASNERMYAPSALESQGMQRQYDRHRDSEDGDAPAAPVIRLRDSYRSSTPLSVVDRGDLTSGVYALEGPERPLMLREEIITSEEDQKIDPRGIKLKIGANINLETEVSNGGSTLSFDPIFGGKFRVFAALVGSNQGLYSELGDEQKILLGINANPVVGEVNNKVLNVEFEMFTNNITNRGDLDLAIKVVPLEAWAEAGVEPFSVVYKLGTVQNLIGFAGDHMDVASAATDFEYDDFLNNVSDFTDRHKSWLIDNGFYSNAHDIIFNSMKIKFRTVKAGETATQRTVIFDVTSCPVEGLSGSRITEGRKFKVLVSGLDPLKCSPQDYTLADGTENPVCRFSKVPIEEIRQDGGNGIFEVRDTGCLAWVDEIAHKYYQRENLIERSYHIVDPNTNEEIFKLDGYFNPWDEKFGTLGVDARNLSESFIQEIKSREKLPSRFFVGDFSYMTLRFRYDIDENMHLTVKKTVLMNLYPYVKRYSNIINGINGNFPIRDGVYLLKIAYQKDYIDPGANGITLQRSNTADGASTRVAVLEGGNQGADRFTNPFVDDDLRRKTFVHIIKKLIRVENNRVITPVEFHIDELRTLRVRSNLLLQLEPVNQYKLQIVNLLERHIAEKLGLQIGDLGAVRCLQPGLLDGLLDLFQQTIDEIALSIPDDINYTSEESFRDVIESDAVVNAITNLTNNGLLDGLNTAFSFAPDEESLRDSLRLLSGGELSSLESSDEYFRVIEEAKQQTLLGQRANLGLIAELSAQASRALVADPDSEGLDTHEGFIKPLNDGSEDGLIPSVQSQLPGHVLGVDQGSVQSAANNLGSTLQTNTPNALPAPDDHTQAFLDEVTRKNELSRLLNNDFTIDPSIARVSDLDYLIDRKAGIIRRTFVGPLTLLALDNKNVMNATDALDYAVSITDGSQDEEIRNAYGDDFNKDYARNPNFGYQGHFKNCHVDDFIVEDKHEELIQNAWSECVSSLKDSTGEVRISKDLTCDYENTQAYQDYMSRQRGDIWVDVDKYNSSPFQRFSRHDDEKRLVNEGRCPYREIWLKKYFSQKMIEKARTQFGNFLSFPSVNAKVVQPDEDDADYSYTSLKVDAIEQECIDKGWISESCLKKTDRFNVSASELARDLVSPDNSSNVRDYFMKPRADLDDETRYEKTYKPALTEFYDKYDKSALNSIEDDSDELKDLSKDIYKTLVSIAAPPVELHERINYTDKLQQVAPADFGRDVQSFMCNLMLPRADKAFHQFFKWYDEASPEDREKSGFNFEDRSNGDTLRSMVVSDGYRGVLYNRFKRALNRCHERAKSDSVEIALPFNIERKFRTLELGRYFFRGGKSINFTVSQGVGVSHGMSASNKYTLDPINSFKKLLDNIPVVGGVLRFFTGMTKLHEYTQSESNGVNDSLGLGTSAHLSMQAAELDLELLKYRRCMLVRWNTDFLTSNGVFDESLKDLAQVIPAMSNIFVCGGEENEKVAIREKYYYVTQHFTEGDLLDSGSLLNNPWLLTLRGYRDMIAFVRSIYPNDDNFLDPDKGLAVIQLMQDDMDRTLSSRNFFVPVQVGGRERSTFEGELTPWETMSMGYRGVTPSFPGLFTQLNDMETSIPNWPWTNEGQIKSPEDNSCDSELSGDNQEGSNE